MNPYALRFWNSVCERVAHGEAPFGTTRKDDCLQYKKHELELARATSSDVVDFFANVVGLQMDFVHFAQWKEIKRKVIKDNLIQEFVTRMQHQYQLESSYAHRLLSTIHLYLTIKRILPAEIQLEIFPHMFIRSIDGIVFKPGRFEYIARQDRDSLASDSSSDCDDEDDSSSSGLEELLLPAEEIDEDDSIE